MNDGSTERAAFIKWLFTDFSSTRGLVGWIVTREICNLNMDRRFPLGAVAAVLLCSLTHVPIFAAENITEELHVKMTSLSDDITQIEASDGNRYLLAVYQVSTNDVSCYTDKHTNVLMAGGSDVSDVNDTTTTDVIDDLLSDPTTVLLSLEKERIKELFLLCINIPEEAVHILAGLTNSTVPVFHRVAVTKRRAKRATGWAIYPGTKWCGAGNKASHYDDLGAYKELDQCCRTHDRCDITIPSWRYRFGKFNWYLWTVSHCSCDDTFRTCLRSRKEFAANMVERIFFNLLGIRCFQFNFLGYAAYRD